MNKIQTVFRFAPGFAVGVLLAGFLALAGNIDGSKAMAEDTDKGEPGKFYFVPLKQGVHNSGNGEWLSHRYEGESSWDPLKRVAGYAAYVVLDPINQLSEVFGKYRSDDPLERGLAYASHFVLSMRVKNVPIEYWADHAFVHKHYYADDNSYNVGYFPEFPAIRSVSEARQVTETIDRKVYYSEIIKKAVKKLEKSGEWEPQGKPNGWHLIDHNCQHFATALRDEYRNVEAILEVRKKVRQAEELLRGGSDYKDQVRRRVEAIDKIGISACSNDFRSKFSKWKAADKKYFTTIWDREYPEGWGTGGQLLRFGRTLSEEACKEYAIRWAEEDKQNLSDLDKQISIMAEYFEVYEDGSDWQLWPFPSTISQYRMGHQPKPEDYGYEGSDGWRRTQ